MKSLKNFLLRGTALLMVLGTTLSAMAQTNYVFLYHDGSTFHILHKNANNNNLSDASTFNPTYAIWSGSSGSNFVNNNRRLSINTNAVGTSNNNRASTISGNTIYRNNYYLRYNNGWTSTATAGDATQCVYVVSGPTTKDWVTSTLAITASGNVTSFNTTGNTTLSTSATYSDAHYTMTANTGSPTYYAISGQSPTTSAPSTAATITWAPNNTSGWTLTSGIYDDGHVRINTTTGYVEYYSEYDDDTELVIKATASATGLTDKTGTYTISIEVPKVDPEGISVTTPMTVYVGQTGTISYTLTPSPCYNNVTYTSNNTSIATVNNSGVVTGVAVGSTTITVSAYTIGGTTSGALTGTVTVIVRNRLTNPDITFTATGTNNQATCEITCATVTPAPTIRYTINGVDPTASTGTIYTGAFTVDDGVEVRAIAVTSADGWDNSGVTTNTWTSVIPTGVVGTVVTLNDLEDHTWTYYSAKPDNDYPDQLRSPDPRNVKITYRGGSVNNASAVAVSATESANEFVYYKTIEKKAWGQDEGRWLTGDYAYKVIPNPFQKRPRTNGTTGTNGFYGFAGWKIVSGGEYIDGHDNNDVLDLEEKINFVNLPAGNDGTGAVVFEATWTAANVATVNDNVTGAGNLGGTGGTYETNFIVVSGNDRTVTGMTRAATVMGCYPDGTGATGARLSTVTGSGNDLKIENINLGTGGSDFTANTGWLIVGRGCTGNVRRVLGNTGQVKIRIESGLYNFIHPMSQNTESNSNYGLIVFGCDYDRATNDGLTSNDQYTDNSAHRKLRVINYVSLNGNYADKASDDDRSEYMDITIKSGYYGFSADISQFNTTLNANGQDGIGLGIGGNTDNLKTTYSTFDRDNNPITYNVNDWNVVNESDFRWQKILSFYCGRTRGGHYGGVNRVLVEGGELSSINGGGYRNTGANFDVCYHFRMRGGWVKGAIYGTASSSQTNATTKQVITGGEINGWVAGACNGTDVDNAAGENLGDTYIYFGGTAELRSHRKDGVYNNAWGLVGGVEGGNLFASGRGTPATAAQPNRNYCGSSYKTYAVVADQSQVEQGVYGGGYIGVAQNSHIYITGGTTGKVFGGASTPTSTNNTWMTQTTDIRMYGGTVKEGIYGGHFEGTGNAGKIHQTVNIAIDGGQVGVDAEHTGKVHGGGYGAGTSVGTDVTVTLGKVGAADSATIFGNVYGGGALGDVNSGNTNTTTVTLNKALVNGNLFGGALGEGADVNGKITVTVNGGNVNGNVFGGGDAAAYSPNANYPVVNMTGGQATNVFGGGMGNTAVVTGNPQVTLSGTAHVTGNVYGGGNAAPVTGNTSVILQD